MSREWKPGDVAVSASVGYRGIFVDHCTKHKAISKSHWHNESGEWDDTNDIRRALIVIDPQSDAELSRLWAILPTNLVSIDQLQAALREFADPKPPKPEEPLGLGAVVEDADGCRWILVYDEFGGDRRWAQVGEISAPGSWRTYADITAVRILSDGVVM